MGEVFVAGAEKKEFPGFRVLPPVQTAPSGDEHGSRRIRTDHGGSQEGEWGYNHLTQEAKTKFLWNCTVPIANSRLAPRDVMFLHFHEYPNRVADSRSENRAASALAVALSVQGQQAISLPTRGTARTRRKTPESIETALGLAPSVPEVE